MRVRERWRLTRTAWDELDEDEREEMLAWDYYKDTHRRNWREALVGKKLLTPEAASLLLLAGME